MADESLSAYIRRTHGKNPEGPDWLADEVQVLEDALAHARHRAEVQMSTDEPFSAYTQRVWIARDHEEKLDKQAIVAAIREFEAQYARAMDTIRQVAIRSGAPSQIAGAYGPPPPASRDRSGS